MRWAYFAKKNILTLPPSFEEPFKLSPIEVFGEDCGIHNNTGLALIIGRNIYFFPPTEGGLWVRTHDGP